MNELHPNQSYSLLFNETLFLSYQNDSKLKITCFYSFEIKDEGSYLIVQALATMG